jgi:D-alanyl-D-alanine carboxypeptidase (penicillin-binding protein 5/6)
MMNLMTRALFLVAALILLVGAPRAVRAQAIETPARHAILIDYDTGAVLIAKDADVPMPPASMSKLMTLTLLFEQLKDGRVKLDDKFPVSEHAWRTGGAGTEGSTMFAALGSLIAVEDLIRGIIVQSGNDACIVVAEALAGTEEAFAQKMNARAKELSLNQSHFVDSTGLPDPEQYMSAHDIARLARHMIRDLGAYYHYFAETEFTWNGIRQANRNPLLYLNVGADGLKTGHTLASGYGLVGSALRNGERLILVVNGLNSEKQRADESRRLLELGFREFKSYALLAAGAEVEKAPVFNGEAKSVSLVVKDPVKVMMMRSSRPNMKVTVHYQAPLVAPVAAGTQVGTLTVNAPGAVPVTVPVYTAEDISRVGPFGQIVNAVIHLVRGRVAEE